MRDAVRFPLAAAVLLISPTMAFANPEPPALYDARVLGMGGAIGPIVDGPAAIYHNPAGLGHVDRFEVNVAVEPMVARLSAPFAGAGTEQDTGWVTAPLGFLGTAFRVHERVTLGFGLYLPTMFGGTYEDVTRIGDCSLPPAEQMTCATFPEPTDQSMALVVAEAALPIAINVLPNLRVGLALRLPYGMQTLDASSHFGATYFRVKQDVAGFGTPGVLFGVQWDPHEQLSLGFAYRSKTRVHMEGTVALPALGANDIEASTDWRVPHMFRAGLAWRPLDDRLRIVAEARLQLHHEANRAQEIEVDFLGGMTQSIPFDWKNVWVVTAGVEYLVTERWPVRIGFSRANSATPRSTVTPFHVPPDLAPAIYAGSGFRGATWSVDAGFGYLGHAGATTRIAAPGPNCSDPTLGTPAGCDGEYQMKTIFAALSFEYALGGRDYVLGADELDGEVETHPDVDMRADPVPDTDAATDSDTDSVPVPEPDSVPESEPAPATI